MTKKKKKLVKHFSNTSVEMQYPTFLYSQKRNKVELQKNKKKKHVKYTESRGLQSAKINWAVKDTSLPVSGS